MSLYPKLQQLITEAIAQKKRSGKLTFTQIANELDFTVARLSTYNTGQRIPPPAAAEKIATYLFNATKDRKSFVESIDAIRANARTAHYGSHDSMLDRLAALEPLRVATFVDEPFSGNAEEFFDQLFHRFFRLSGLTTTTVDLPGCDVQRALAENVMDLCLSCFASVDRSLLAHFWTTPIRLSLGIVLHQRQAAEQQLVKEVFAQRRRITGRRFRPITVKGEAGAVYCKETLQFDEPDLVYSKDLSPKRLANYLRQLSKEPDLPFIVVDEFASFKVLRELGGEGIPVVPLSKQESIIKDLARRELPQYFLSFACSRRQHELRDMIDQSFWLFLSTELNTTAHALAVLYKDLMKELTRQPAVVDYYFDHVRTANPMEIEALRFQHARSWSFYALSLDRNCIDEYSSSGLPWKPILQRAREIVQADLAKDLSIINGQIDYCSHYYDPATPFSHDRFQTLCEIFDLPVPHLTDAQQQYVFEDREMVLATIQATLKGEAIPVLEPAVLVTAMTEEVSAIAARFIGEISQMYVGEVGEQNPASQEIKLDLLVPGDSPTERYQKLSAVFPAVILVSYGKHGHHYVGCACLRPYKGSTATAKDLELRYLFVSKPFRKMKMARYILYWAHRYAKEKGYSALVFEALPEFFEGALYLEKRHFSQTQRRGDYGWIVLEYPTARPFKYPGRQEPSESNYVGL